MTQQLDIQLTRGDQTPSYRLTVRGDDNTPVDLTGYTATAQIGSRAVPSVAVGTTDVTSASTGVILVGYSGAQTTLLRAGEQYTHEVRITGPGQSPLTIVDGIVSVHRSLALG